MRAQTAGNCQDLFNVLREDTLAVTITGKSGDKFEKERAGLLKVVDDAQALVSIGKTSDAFKKLSDFTVKVDQLEAAGRTAPRVPTCCAPTRRRPSPVCRVQTPLRRKGQRLHRSDSSVLKTTAVPTYWERSPIRATILRSRASSMPSRTS